MKRSSECSLAPEGAAQVFVDSSLRFRDHNLYADLY
jgi:hypothetical protein